MTRNPVQPGQPAPGAESVGSYSGGAEGRTVSSGQLGRSGNASVGVPDHPPSPAALQPLTVEIGPGSVVDRRYCLRRVIAHGGGGTVFEAEQMVSGRRVALKLVMPGDAGWVEKGARLQREARALVLAQQANVVQVLDAGTDATGIPYLVLELLEGRALNGILAARRVLSASEAVTIGLALCEALRHAHRRGVLHRDVKPGNVFITRNEVGDEVVKLIDFGIARVAKEETAGVRITQVGAIVGTPEYLPPEQLLAREDCDHRVDVYSLGVLLYECLTGGVPFEGSFGEIVLRVSTEPVPPLRARNPAVPAQLEAVVMRALAREPALRFHDMAEMAAALEQLLPDGNRAQVLIRPQAEGQPPAPPLRAVTEANQKAPAAAGFEGRRRFARAPYVTPIRLVLPDGSVVDGRTEDISEGGLLALVPRRCESELPIQLRFALPMTGRIVTLNARSRWVRVARVGAAAGLEFIDLPEDCRAAIRTYVSLMRGE
ncbi:MAG: protein kinase [Polyangiaceae bacterium]|nr:protein kinase [Polyangiaceae bacterium]